MTKRDPFLSLLWATFVSTKRINGFAPAPNHIRALSLPHRSSPKRTDTVLVGRRHHFFETTHRNQKMTSTPSNDEGLTDIGAEPSDSVVETTVTPWQKKMEVSVAKSRKIRGSNYVQIATTDTATNEPRVRTVVFRGFLENRSTDRGATVGTASDPSRAMKMITDLRSDKVSESRTAELLWWFSKSSEQYRVRGELVYVGGGDFDSDTDECMVRARKQQWGNLSDMAREQFYWRDPGVDYETQVVVPPGGRDEEGKVLPPPKNFLLMLLFPRRVDYLRLGDNFRQLDEFGGGVWRVRRVNP